jgi:hypothetical protein
MLGSIESDTLEENRFDAISVTPERKTVSSNKKNLLAIVVGNQRVNGKELRQKPRGSAKSLIRQSENPQEAEPEA